MFDLIREADGSDQYICLYSVGLASHDRKEYGEADFVVIGPEGVFSIEAKGGDVRRADGVWHIGPPGNTYESHEGPFKQSEATVWPIREYLKGRLRISRDDCLVGWGVAFPHTTFRDESPDWHRDVIYDERDKSGSFINFIKRLDQYHRGRLAALGRKAPPRLSATDVTKIAGALRPNIATTATLKGLIAESRRELARLSPAQFSVLDFALNDRNPQILCDGAAGTGKTLIALEAARRLSAQGKKVLFLCFNEQLGRFLAADAAETAKSVKVSTVYGFMAETIREAGLGAALSGADPRTVFREVYPALFEKAAESLADAGQLPIYDTIILDEAQDVLSADVLNCLDLVLQNGFRNGRWLICIDTGLQSDVYGSMDKQVLSFLRSVKPFEALLTDNFRNPKNVVAETCVLTSVERPTCKRDVESNVDYRVYGDERDQGRKLRALLLDLIRDGASPGEITILSSKKPEEACVSRFPPDIGQKIFQLEKNRGACPSDQISAASVSAFKGLENEIVVLTDLPELEPMSAWAKSIIYVGMTRARSKLFMLVSKEFLDARSHR